MRCFGLVMVGFMLAASGAHASYVEMDERHTIIGSLMKTEKVIQFGGDANNRFVMTRVVALNPLQPIRGAVLLVPGQALNFSSFELSDRGDYTTSLVGYLALNGVDVYGYSPRSAQLRAGACEEGAVDCNALFRGWDMNAELDDLDYVRGWIAENHPDQLPVIGGYSLGAGVTFAALDRNPQAYAGAILFDGAVHTRDSASREANAARCAQLEQQLATGSTYDGSTFPLLKDLARRQRTTPWEPAPYSLGGIPKGTPYRQMYMGVLTSELPVPRVGFREAVGDPATNQFGFADETRLEELILRFNDYDILPLLRDFHCALAGQRPTFSDGLRGFQAPVLSLLSGRGFGHVQDDSVALLGSYPSRVERHALVGHGHFDLFATPYHRQLLSERVLGWLRSTVYP